MLKQNEDLLTHIRQRETRKGIETAKIGKFSKTIDKRADEWYNDRVSECSRVTHLISITRYRDEKTISKILKGGNFS